MWGGYDIGFKRTACRICPGQSPAVYALLRKKYKDIWEEILYLAKRLKYGAWWQAPDGSPGDFVELADRGDRMILNKES